jgi:hypothetical protein
MSPLICYDYSYVLNMLLHLIISFFPPQIPSLSTIRVASLTSCNWEGSWWKTWPVAIKMADHYLLKEFIRQITTIV